MRRAALLAATLLFSGGSAFAAPAPECRLDASHAAAVGDALTRALRVLDPEQRRLARVSVNRLVNDPRTLNVQIVADAERDAVDAAGCARRVPRVPQLPDRHTIPATQICRVDAGPPLLLKCSAGAIGLVRAVRPADGHASEPLLYVLAHEAAHVVRGDAGRFSPDAVPIQLGVAPETRLGQIRREICDAPVDQAQLHAETRADADALAVLKRWLPEAPYRDVRLDLQASMAMAVNRIRLAAEALAKEVLAARDKRREPRDFKRLPLPASAEYVAWVVDRALCEVMESSRGEIFLPPTASTHPEASMRMQAISSELLAFGKTMRGPAGSAAAATLPGNLDALIGDTGGIFGVLDAQEADFRRAFTTFMCTERIHPERRPSCEAIRAIRAPAMAERCRVLDAPLVAEAYRGVPATLTLRRSADGALELPAGATFAAPLDGGAVALGFDDPPRAAAISAGAQSADLYPLPCRPTWAAGTLARSRVTCAAPTALVELHDGRPRAIQRVLPGLFDGDPVRPDDISLQWVGEAGARTIAAGQIGQAGGFTFHIGADRLTLPAAWQGGAGCSMLRGAHAVWRVAAGGDLVGATWDPRATQQAAHFAPDLARVTALFEGSPSQARENAGSGRVRVVPLGDTTSGCGPSYAHGGLVCVEADGTVRAFPSPGAPRTITRLAPTEAWRKARSYHARPCVTRHALYVLLVADGGVVPGAVPESTVYRAAVDGTGARKLVTWPTANAELACNADAAVALLRDGSRSVVLQLR